jgi:NAD(P)-dependent dehydrogenase (short-subunit alcohol dehydrogenase family)
MLLLHGRDRERGRRTVAELREDTGNERLGLYLADYCSLEEVRAMGEQIRGEHDALHVLVNNAGIGTTLPGEGRRMESDEGHELRFQVNYLAGYLLTRTLEPLLVRSAPARIVNISSASQMPIDFEDVMLERGYSGARAYSQSKLAQVHTFDLAEYHTDDEVTANCLHPASYMPTKLALAARGRAVSSLREGVDATLRLIADRSLDGVSGRYYKRQRAQRAHRQAYDQDARDRLQALSAQLTARADRSI